MGGSSADQTRTDEFTDNSSNFTLTDTDGAVVGGGDVNVTQSDFGAVQEAFGFGRDSMRETRGAFDGVLDLARDTLSSGQNLVGQSINASRSEGAQLLQGSQDQRNRMILIVTGGAVVLGAVYLISTRGR